MIFGYSALGPLATPLTTDTGYVSKYRLIEQGYVQKITAALDGLGAGGTQDVRAVIYTGAGVLVGSSSAAVTIQDGQVLTWIDFAFQSGAAPNGLPLPEGDYLLGLQANGITGCARFWGVADVVNLIPNPSIETNTTSWAQNAATGSFARDSAVAMFGASSLHQTNPGTNAHEGPATTSVAVAASATYTAAVWVLGAVAGTALALELQERTSGDALVAGSSQTFTTTGLWQRVTVSRSFGSTGVKARVVIRANATAASSYWVDAAMLVQDSAAPDYFDGDSTGRVWLGTAHGSASAVGKSYADTYSDGATATIPGTAAASPELSLFATYTHPYKPPTGVDDEYLAALPFDAAQATLGATEPIVGSDIEAQCGWHGTLTDPNRGMVAIVQTGGPLADLVGERIKLSYDERSVVVFVTSELDVLDDISLTRRAFMALETPATESITVTIETLAGNV